MASNKSPPYMKIKVLQSCFFPSHTSLFLNVVKIHFISMQQLTIAKDKTKFVASIITHCLSIFSIRRIEPMQSLQTHSTTQYYQRTNWPHFVGMTYFAVITDNTICTFFTIWHGWQTLAVLNSWRSPPRLKISFRTK